jgi:WD40 repeat protein
MRIAQFDPATSQLKVNEAPILDGSLMVRNSAMSRDGKMVAFTSDGREDVFVMRSDGTDMRQLTDDDARDRGPSWTPDGRICFYSSRSGTYQVWTIRPDGSELTQASHLPEINMPNFPVVSPDGKRITAGALAVGAWTAAFTGGAITTIHELPRITVDGDAAFWPQSWSPDGTRLAGPRWISDGGIYVHTLADGSYRKVSEDGRRASWVNDHQLLVLSDVGVTLVDVTSGTRSVLRSADMTYLSSICSGEHCVLLSRRAQRDIWMATLPAPEK